MGMKKSGKNTFKLGTVAKYFIDGAAKSLLSK